MNKKRGMRENKEKRFGNNWIGVKWVRKRSLWRTLRNTNVRRADKDMLDNGFNWKLVFATSNNIFCWFKWWLHLTGNRKVCVRVPVESLIFFNYFLIIQQFQVSINRKKCLWAKKDPHMNLKEKMHIWFVIMKGFP